MLFDKYTDQLEVFNRKFEDAFHNVNRKDLLAFQEAVKPLCRNFNHESLITALATINTKCKNKNLCKLFGDYMNHIESREKYFTSGLMPIIVNAYTTRSINRLIQNLAEYLDKTKGDGLKQ